MLDAYKRLGRGTVGGDPDPAKLEQINFYEKHRAGISDDEARRAIAKFGTAVAAHDATLGLTPFLLGNALSVLDIALFIYVARLTAAGYPFAEAHPNVSRWFNQLLARQEFCRGICRVDAETEDVSPCPRAGCG